VLLPVRGGGGLGSRPVLLKTVVLMPGRLGRHIHCIKIRRELILLEVAAAASTAAASLCSAASPIVPLSSPRVGRVGTVLLWPPLGGEIRTVAPLAKVAV
jgi:hypothetical protein